MTQTAARGWCTETGHYCRTRVAGDAVFVSERAEQRRWTEHDNAWRELQEFHLANALYLGARLDGLVNDYMAGIIRAVAGWQAGRQPRGNVHDWSTAFSGLKALGETTLEQITREIRDALGIRDASSGSESPDSSRGS